MKTVLVTGGNRGIGLEICRQLSNIGYQVILGSRNKQNGIEAARTLNNNIFVKQLDVTSEESIQKLFFDIKSDFGKLDVLINNAGLGTNFENSQNVVVSNLKKIVKTNFDGVWKMIKKINPILLKAGIGPQKNNTEGISLQSVKQLMETNFYGPWRMTQVFIPLLRKSENGRIINMSSGMGELKSLNGDFPAYRLSKSSLNALTIMFANELKSSGICVNAMCPGWVKTDMGGPDAPRTVSEGADTAVWLSTEPSIPSGKFFRDRKEINW